MRVKEESVSVRKRRERGRRRTALLVDVVRRLPDDCSNLVRSPRQDLVLLLSLRLLLLLDLFLRSEPTVDRGARPAPLRLEVDPLGSGDDLLVLVGVPVGDDALELVAETLCRGEDGQRRNVKEPKKGRRTVRARGKSES